MLRSLLILTVAAACARHPSSAVVAPAAPATPVAPAAEIAPPSSTELSGTVLEKIDASQYSYLRLSTASGEVWAAVPKADIAVGSSATVSGAMWMEDFKSATLNRTWPRIAFGVLGTQPAPAQQQPGHTPGMFAQAAKQTGSSAAPPPDGAPISVPRATGKEGRTIAEIYSQKRGLAGAHVRVRGKVVKETDGVMGKNWLHLRDGSGKGELDLAVASDDSSAVGETVVVAGVIHLDRDLGAGYHYDVILEEAKIEPPTEARR